MLAHVVATFLLAATPIRVLIITGASDEPYHHWRETTACLHDVLTATNLFSVAITEEPQRITPDSLASYDVLLLNYNGPRFPAAAETAIEEFIASGKGFVAFHHASYGTFFGMEFRDRHWIAGPDAGWAAFPRIIGAHWNPPDIGHARRTTFTVDYRDAANQPFTADDELYHKLKLDPDTRVLADALSPRELGGTGNREPMIWTHTFGKGRVYFTTLGHDTKALTQPGLLDALQRGIEWAATGRTFPTR